MVALAVTVKLTCKAQSCVIRQVVTHEQQGIQGRATKTALEGHSPHLLWWSGTNKKCYIKKEGSYGQKFPDEAETEVVSERTKVFYCRKEKQSRWEKDQRFTCFAV